jgi:hypothetical protein
VLVQSSLLRYMGVLCLHASRAECEIIASYKLCVCLSHHPRSLLVARGDRVFEYSVNSKQGPHALGGGRVLKHGEVCCTSVGHLVGKGGARTCRS